MRKLSSAARHRLVLIPTVPGVQPEIVLIDRIVEPNGVVGIEGHDGEGRPVTAAFAVTMHVSMPNKGGLETVMIAARQPQLDTLLDFLNGVPLPMEQLEQPQPRELSDDDAARLMAAARAAVPDSGFTGSVPSDPSIVIVPTPGSDTVH